MIRRRFLLCFGPIIATLSGCTNREQGDTPDNTSNQTSTLRDSGNNRGQTETMQSTDQHLVIDNRDDKHHSVRVSVSATDDEILGRTVDIAADERRWFVLDIDEPGTYTVSAAVDRDTAETWSINFDDYDIREGSNVFIEINDGEPDVYWEE